MERCPPWDVLWGTVDGYNFCRNQPDIFSQRDMKAESKSRIVWNYRRDFRGVHKKDRGARHGN